MTPRPKYVATRDFRHGPHNYTAGDPISDAATLQALLVHGDKFVTNTATRRADPPTDPGPETATPKEE